MTLAEFLKARLGEDEATAKAATPGPWRIEGMAIRGAPDGSFAAPSIKDTLVVRHTWPQEASHIIRHDPARVLREVAAKRAILAEHAPSYPTTCPKPSGQPACGVCHAGGWDWEPEKWPCATVRALAAIWSDHEAYDARWKP